MSNIQIRTTNNILTASVVILVIISVSALLQLHAIPLVLSVPLFLVPVSIYATIIGLKYKPMPHLTPDHSYYLTWAAIMLAGGISGIVLYEKMGLVIVAIAVLSVALGYIYLNKIKSAVIYAN